MFKRLKVNRLVIDHQIGRKLIFSGARFFQNTRKCVSNIRQIPVGPDPETGIRTFARKRQQRGPPEIHIVEGFLAQQPDHIIANRLNLHVSGVNIGFGPGKIGNIAFHRAGRLAEIGPDVFDGKLPSLELQNAFDVIKQRRGRNHLKDTFIHLGGNGKHIDAFLMIDVGDLTQPAF